jgi:hypothetical protein
MRHPSSITGYTLRSKAKPLVWWQYVLVPFDSQLSAVSFGLTVHTVCVEQVPKSSFAVHKLAEYACRVRWSIG